MPQSENSTHNTPLAPSVEKAYYRKCIQLKRRLNEIESDNDSRKIKIERLNRSILKMRLERAFLLDELRKRMQYNVDGSEGSGSDGATTPPPDRPHRDKRRRPDSGRQATTAGPSYQYQQQPTPQVPSQGERDDLLPTTQINGSNTSPAHGADERDPISRSAAATGEELTAGPNLIEDANVFQLLNDPDFKDRIKDHLKNKHPSDKSKQGELDSSSAGREETYDDLRRNYKNTSQRVRRVASAAPGVAARLTTEDWCDLAHMYYGGGLNE